MPVTAKLSRRFYETFGDDIANELVDWFNQVDMTYRGELREINDLNYLRFEAKLDQRVAQLDAKLEQRIAELRAEMAGQRADLIKWMFLIWAGTVLPLGGLIVALNRP